ncbi:MAG TPA: hypothetical protein VHI13_15825 [Candidatus Kapabacteria bacterium]|nr:hypothetical protein [Candidatus Kapabacteria bacterium]
MSASCHMPPGSLHRGAAAIASVLCMLLCAGIAGAQHPGRIEADSLRARNDSVDWNRRGLAWLSCGGGPRGVTAGFGFRYRWFGAEQSVITNGTETPPYYPDNRAVPNGTFTVVSFPDPAIGIDGQLFYDIDRLSLFLAAGYFEQTNHLLRRSDVNGRFYSGPDDSVQHWFGFGGGMQYYFTPAFAVGCGFHSFRGAYLLVGFWP